MATLTNEPSPAFFRIECPMIVRKCRRVYANQDIDWTASLRQPAFQSLDEGSASPIESNTSGDAGFGYGSHDLAGGFTLNRERLLNMKRFARSSGSQSNRLMQVMARRDHERIDFGIT